jgi:hypothetical protein
MLGVSGKQVNWDSFFIGKADPRLVAKSETCFPLICCEFLLFGRLSADLHAVILASEASSPRSVSSAGSGFGGGGGF